MGGTNTFLLTETIHQRLNSKHYLDLAGPLVCNFCEKLLDVGDMVTSKGTRKSNKVRRYHKDCLERLYL